jgi:hypothetical protein
MKNRLTGWLSLSTDTFKSGHAQLSFLPEFRSGAFVIPGRVEDANPESLDSPICRGASEVGPPDHPGMMAATYYVSTSPVLDPLAVESLRPWGSAR